MKHIHFIISLTLLAGTLTGMVSCRSASDAVTRSEKDMLLENIFPAVLRIEVVSPAYRGGRKFREQSVGSGVIVSDSGLVVTNHHVAGRAEQILCRFTDGSTVPGTLVGTDAMTDIAVIQLDLSQRRSKEPLPVVKWGSSAELRVGEPVFAIGCPGALAQSITQGIIANTAFIMPGAVGGLRLDGAQVGAIVRWVLHDAQIFGGNSGGPLVNRRGEIVGINEISYAGLAGAVPSDLAREVVEAIVDSGKVTRAWTGLFYQELLSPMVDSGIKGVLIGDVLPNSPAAESGIKPGDILTRFDGRDVSVEIPEELPGMNRLEMSVQVGKEIVVTVLRDGVSKDFKITPAARPSDTYDIEAVEKWEMTALDITRMLRNETQLSVDSGVFIHSIKANGLLNTATPKIRGGDVITAVNNTPVTNIAHLSALTDSLLTGIKTERPVLVTVQRRDQSLISVAKFNPPEENAPARAARAWFPASVQVLTRDIKSYLKLNAITGVRITEIYPGRAVEKAGLRIGDILTSIDGEKIETRREEDGPLFTDMVRQYRIGSEAEFAVLRDGKPIKITVKLDDPAITDDAETHESEITGLTVRNLNFDEKIRCEKKKLPEGVCIQQIERGSPAAIARMSSGGVILAVDGTPVSDTDTFRTVVEKAAADGRKSLVMFVREGTGTQYYDVRIK